MKATLLFLGGIGMQEILLISVFVLIFFGAKKIPDFMKGIGKGVREFKEGIKEVKHDIDTSVKDRTITETTITEDGLK
jgi:sec-independent protein translocase protein TatA